MHADDLQKALNNSVEGKGKAPMEVDGKGKGKPVEIYDDEDKW